MTDVRVFEHANFQGRSRVLPTGRYDDALKQLTIGNNSLSSLQVPKGLVVRLYEHLYFQGRFIDIRSDTPVLTQFWNDRTRSLVVYDATEPPPVITTVMIFEHENYRGACQLLPIGKYEAAQIRIGKKTLRSVLVPYGMSIQLFHHPGFRGTNITLRDDTPVVGLDWNACTASLVVEKSPVGLWQPVNTKRN